MSKLEYYSDLDSKREKFSSGNDYHKIYDKDMLKSFIDYLEGRKSKMKNPDSLIFRSVHEAKYKLYSSGQRAWLTKEIFNFDKYFDMVNKIISTALGLRNNLLESFYDELRVLNKVMASMSFLQHYGSPTPLTDWTHNHDVGLFFTTYLNNYKESDKDDINNYMSLYEINLREDSKELVNIGELAQEASINSNIYSKSKKFSPTDIIRQLNINSFFTFHLFYISDFYNKVRGNFPRTYINSNLNIISQRGLFIFNASEDKPLEEIFLGIPYTEDENIARTRHLHKIECYNIHKNLSEHITEYLNRKSISKKTMFPQEEEVASESFYKYLDS